MSDNITKAYEHLMKMINEKLNEDNNTAKLADLQNRIEKLETLNVIIKEEVKPAQITEGINNKDEKKQDGSWFPNW